MKYVATIVFALLCVLTSTGIFSEQSCPESIQNARQCAVYLEEKLAKKFPDLFLREGGRLVITLNNGKKKTFIDIPDEERDGEQGMWFNIVDYYPDIHYALVAVHFFEGQTHYLVNRGSGSETEIISSPVVSPDKKRIAVANEDLHAEYTPNYLAVFRLHSDKLKKEFEVIPEDWGARDLRWVNNQELSFTEYRFSANPESGGESDSLVGKPRKLKLRLDEKTKGQKWLIE